MQQPGLRGREAVVAQETGVRFGARKWGLGGGGQQQTLPRRTAAGECGGPPQECSGPLPRPLALLTTARRASIIHPG